MENLATRFNRIIKKDKRYHLDAYEFVLAALSFTQKKTKKHRHISGQELACGIRDYAVEQFGGLSQIVLEHWGIKSTEDFGEIVFNMVRENILYKREADSKEDFKDVYDFEDAFKARFDTTLI